MTTSFMVAGSDLPLEHWVHHSALWPFLYDWQTVIAGLLALAAAGWTIRATRSTANKQIKEGQAQTAVAQKQIEATLRQFRLEGPFLQPIIQSSTIAEGLTYFFRYDHPTSPVTPVASETGFTIRNVGRSAALLVSAAVKLDHWTEMVEEPRVDFLARYDVEPVIEPGEETKQAFTAKVTIPIDKAAFASLRNGESYLFLYGEIGFADLLGEDYVQTFCFYYNFDAKRFVRSAGRYNRRASATRAKGEAAGKGGAMAVGRAVRA